MAALHDLNSIDAYTVRQWGDAQADRYLNRLQSCFNRLAENPLLGRECQAIRPGLRRIEQDKHVIFNRKTEDGIRVSRILHRGMLPDRHSIDD